MNITKRLVAVAALAGAALLAINGGYAAEWR